MAELPVITRSQLKQVCEVLGLESAKVLTVHMRPDSVFVEFMPEEGSFTGSIRQQYYPVTED